MADSFSYLLAPLPGNILQAIATLAGPLNAPLAQNCFEHWLPRFVATGRPVASLREYIGDTHCPGTIEKVAKASPKFRAGIADGLRAGLSHCSILEVNSLARGDKELASASRQLMRLLKAELSTFESESSRQIESKRTRTSWADSKEITDRLVSEKMDSSADLVLRNIEELDAGFGRF